MRETLGSQVMVVLVEGVVARHLLFGAEVPMFSITATLRVVVAGRQMVGSPEVQVAQVLLAAPLMY
jgi:hypothetical protein